jgi:hypothetical protein
MKNIKSIIITLVVTLLLGLLPTTTTQATTINQNQNTTLTCCNLAYNKILDFSTQQTANILTPTQSANVDIYNTFINSLESQGMNWDEIVKYITPNSYNK